MRSRFTAYTRQAIDYLVATTDPDSRPDRISIERWATKAVFTGLRIVATSEGGADDQQGIVEFVAYYRSGGVDEVHHERSRFRRRQGVWLYCDAEQVKTSAATPGRNDACPCGSGRKYKKCHGAVA